ncbi:MAG: hypothetical protein J5552_10050 [Prevotella sp.]|nr:hypothetical protein [Prevotella sp.]MBR4898969.1 hypothetical protein [Prevotella sp.]
MKPIIIIIAIMLMPISTTSLHAQENKHAQALHTAFRETLDKRFPKNISSRWIPGSKDSLSIIYTALDGGGLVPKNKIHVVPLGKGRAHIGPNYLDGWSFEFRNVPDDPNLPLRQILDAYDKQSPFAASYYSYVAGDEQAVFPGVSIAYGEGGETFPLQLHPTMNVRIIGFKDDDGFRSTYLLMWKSEEEENADTKHKYYATGGIMYEFHCPKLKATPQIKSYDDEEYLDRSNTALSVAQNMLFDIRKKEPERAKALDTDTLAEVFQYNFIKMAQQLYDEPRTFNLKTSYEALKAKVWLMTGIGNTATLTEQKAICYTLNKEVESYPYMLSWRQAEELMNMTNGIANDMPDDLKQQVNIAQMTINAQRNLTADIDSLSDNDQDYLNRNHWTVIHQPMDYHREDMFTARGEHYTADQQTGYLHVKRENYGSGLRIENTLKNLCPGRYRVSAVVRAKNTDSGHSGLLVFAQVGDQTVRKEIPADGDAGGNVWFSALNRFSNRANAHEGVLALDLNKASAHGGQGYGWNRIYLDDITITNESGNSNLTYGVTLAPDVALNSAECSNWFSACDFIVERVGD